MGASMTIRGREGRPWQALVSCFSLVVNGLVLC